MPLLNGARLRSGAAGKYRLAPNARRLGAMWFSVAEDAMHRTACPWSKELGSMRVHIVAACGADGVVSSIPPYDGGNA